MAYGHVQEENNGDREQRIKIEGWEMLRNIEGNAQIGEKKRKSKSAHTDRERGETVNFHRETKSLHSFSESSSFSTSGSRRVAS